MLIPRRRAHLVAPGSRRSVPNQRPAAVGVADVEGVVARERALETLAWVIPTLLMAGLGLVRLSWSSLWADELATWGFVATAWDRAVPVLGDIDAVIAPYYLLMYGWAEVFGTSEFALRLPSALAMTGAAGLTAALGTRLAGPRTGLLAGLVFAVIPTTSRYAQEARPYALAVFAAVLATFVLVRVVERPRISGYVCYALSLWLLGLSHVVALLLLAAHGLVVLAMRPKAAGRWAAMAIVGVLPAAPFLWFGSQQKNQISWIPPADLARVALLPETLFGFAILGGAVLALGLTSIGLARREIVVSAWALVPTIGLFVAAQVTPLWLPRYLLFTIPAWALLAALSLGRTTLFRAVAAMAVLAIVALPTHLDVRQSDGHGQATRALANTLVANTQPGDGLVYGPNSRGEGRVGRDLVARYVPPDRQPKDLLASRPPRTDGKIMAVECPDIAKCLSDTPRLWLIRVGRTTSPLAGLGGAKERALGEGYKAERTWQFRGLTLCLLIRKTEQPQPVAR